MIRQALFVGLGGGLGAIARFLVHRLVQPGIFPLGTFLVNISGCLAIGLIWGSMQKSNSLSSPLALFLMTGICGGYTTFSAFGLETVALLREERWSMLIVYTTGSVLAGILATVAGIKLTSS